MDRSGPDKEGWEEVLKLDLAAGEWGGGLHMLLIEPSTGCLEELNTASSLESGVPTAMTKFTRTPKMRPLNSA